MRIHIESLTINLPGVDSQKSNGINVSSVDELLPTLQRIIRGAAPLDEFADAFDDDAADATSAVPTLEERIDALKAVEEAHYVETDDEYRNMMETAEYGVDSLPDALPPTQENALQAQLASGKVALEGFIADWLVNYGAPTDADGLPLFDQPDRKKMCQVVLAKYGKNMLSYIASCGGLRKAIHSVLPHGSVPEGVGSKDFADEVAGNVVQIASIVSPPLADTIEYTYEDSRG